MVETKLGPRLLAVLKVDTKTNACSFFQLLGNLGQCIEFVEAVDVDKRPFGDGADEFIGLFIRAVEDDLVAWHIE